MTDQFAELQVHTYAAICIEKLLRVKDQTPQAVDRVSTWIGFHRLHTWLLNAVDEWCLAAWLKLNVDPRRAEQFCYWAGT